MSNNYIFFNCYRYVIIAIIATAVSILTGGGAIAQDPKNGIGQIATLAGNKADQANNDSKKTNKLTGEGLNVVGSSVDKRPIEASVFGKGANTILILAGIHGDETITVDFAEILKKEIVAGAIKIEPSIKCIVVSKVNPDGVFRKTRTNARAIDINRNFPTKNWTSQRNKNRYYGGTSPASEPETIALMELINASKPKIILSIHSPLKVVNYDGPAELIAKRFSQKNRYPLKADIGYPTPGSLGTYSGIERNIPTITLELEPTKIREVWDRNRDALVELLSKPIDSSPPNVPTKSPVKKTLKYKTKNMTKLDESEFKIGVEKVLSDSRGWVSGGVSFEEVTSGTSDLTIVLAAPEIVDSLCRPLETYGTWSCRNGKQIIINSARWTGGYWRWKGPIEDYRSYLVNHEMGHALGLGHSTCSENGRSAPVMMQQSKGLGMCVRNAWPREDEIKTIISKLNVSKGH